MANGTAFGLSSDVFTNRLNHIMRFIAELNYGTVNIQEVPDYRIEMSPFGAIKGSGLDYKEGFNEAIKSFTNVKTFSLPPCPARPLAAISGHETDTNSRRLHPGRHIERRVLQ